MKKILSMLTMPLLFIGLNSSSCKHEVDPIRIKIKNNSNSAVYYALSYSYPDTALNRIEVIPHNKGNTSSKINANDSDLITTGILGISPITQMFIFDANTIEHTPWDSIVKHNMVLKRYQLTESDVRKANWTITYP
ncbi:hypothetical protein [Mucilaginibacter panaciglaebae]|uniref:Lipoprotein n=1 Tax=Mucilaginibacter panaciglaebae TaxID=502331 RepID=A0ABP7X4J2_9SPHI